MRQFRYDGPIISLYNAAALGDDPLPGRGRIKFGEQRDLSDVQRACAKVIISDRGSQLLRGEELTGN